jgi:hypothetical protein
MAEREIVERPAAEPDADLACDFAIAVELTQEGFRERLAREVVAPVRQIDGGVEVTFTPRAWDLVMKYIEVESQCCPFLNLAARKTADAVVLSVTGRPEARPVIDAIFSNA